MVPSRSGAFSSPTGSKRASTSRSLQPAKLPKNSPHLPHQLSQSAKPSPKLKTQSQETNINVYVRCRSRNDREIKENSGVVVSTTGQDGKDVIIQTNQTTAVNKTYTFDKVFGAESDQETLFENVAQNALNELLQGYNCTIFAYGQTGTGKTYTMSGDISTTANGVLGLHAGIIPRTLVQLFQKLTSKSQEHAVRVSFLELYNEELKDLLCPDDCERKVRIYDDHGKKTIVVQGMEEVFIQNAQDGLKLLEHGSIKRQVAATQCNDLSSRSHTVFTITIQMKKIDPISGEEYVKVGKLNLVDLAGSENITRSGAENKRAREAGMINQSLLTLGRVINCLVDKSPHIPYRESKLTRILQDLLGGQTKTCIIATISPAKVSLEETISTLEYASRAQNIKNKPLVNQTRTKEMLFGEYIEEIERLRKDLAVTREQSGGVYITTENYQKLMGENESRMILVEEQKIKIDLLEDQNRRFQETNERQIEECKLVKSQLSELETTLGETQSQLQAVEQRAMNLEDQLQDEIVVREEFERNTKQTQSYYQSLITIVNDILLSRDKLEGIIQDNINTFARNDDLLKAKKSQVYDLLDNGFQKSINLLKAQHETSLQQLSSNFETVIKNHQDTLQESIKRIEHDDANLTEGANNVNSLLINAISNMGNLLQKSLQEIIKKQNDIISMEIPLTQRKFNELLESRSGLISKTEDDIQDSYHSIGQKFKTAFELIESQFTIQLNELIRLTEVSKSHDEALTQSLQKVIESNNQKHDNEMREQEEELKSLIAKITDLIKDSTSQRQSRMSQNLSKDQSILNTITQDSTLFHNSHYSSLDNLVESEKIFTKAISDGKTTLKSSLVLSHESNKAKFALINENIKDLGSTQNESTQHIANLVGLNTQSIQRVEKSSDETAKKESDNIQRSFVKLKSDTKLTMQVLSKNFTNFNNSLTDIKPSLIDPFAQRQTESLEVFSDSSKQSNQELKDTMSALELAKPNNVLPKYENYEYPTTLPTPKPREELLKYKKRKIYVPKDNDINESKILNDLENATPLPVPIPDRPMVENTPCSMNKVKHIKNINRVNLPNDKKLLRPLQQLNL